MALRDEYAAVLRDVLGPGFETTTLAELMKRYTIRALAEKVKARLKARIDATAFLAARQAAEATLAAEEVARKQAEADVDTLVETNMGSI